MESTVITSDNGVDLYTKNEREGVKAFFFIVLG